MPFFVHSESKMDSSLPTDSESFHESNYSAYALLWSPASGIGLPGYGNTFQPALGLSQDTSTNSSSVGFGLEPMLAPSYQSNYCDSISLYSPVLGMCLPSYSNTLPLAPSLTQDTSSSSSSIKHESEPTPSLVYESNSSDSASTCSPVSEICPPGHGPTLLPAPSRTHDTSTDGSSSGHASQPTPSPSADFSPMDLVRKTCERCYRLNFKCGGQPQCRRCKANGVDCKYPAALPGRYWRGRIMAACHFCREAKLKCNGVDQCRTCKVRGRKCTYPKGSLKVCRMCDSLHRISSGGKRPLCEQCKARRNQSAPSAPRQQSNDTTYTYPTSGTFNWKAQQPPVYFPYPSQHSPPRQDILGTSLDQSVYYNPPLIGPSDLSLEAQFSNADSGTDATQLGLPSALVSPSSSTSAACLPYSLIPGQGVPYHALASPTSLSFANQLDTAAQYSTGESEVGQTLVYLDQFKQMRYHSPSLPEVSATVGPMSHKALPLRTAK